MSAFYKAIDRAESAMVTVLGALVFGLVFTFILVNATMGCETWDQSKWTEQNSCITPSEALQAWGL